MAKRLKGLKKLNKAIAEPLKDRFGISYAEMCNGEFFYSFEDNSIGWTLIEKGYGAEDFNNFIAERFGYTVTCPFVISLLHEVGHAKNNDDIDGAVYDFCTKEKDRIADAVYEATDREEIRKLNYQYFNLPDEIMATAWAIEYATKHPRIVKKMWSDMWGAILKFYEDNNLEED